MKRKQINFYRRWQQTAKAQRTAGRTVTADDTALQALRRRRAGTLAAEFLHQMQALGLTEAEIETLLRETAQQAPKKE